MKKTVKRFTAAVVTAAMALCATPVVHADSPSTYSDCYHGTLTASVEGPYHEATYYEHMYQGKTCRVTRSVGFLVQRCVHCGTIVSKDSYTIPIDHHSISHP